ncbi:MAG: hypothetical protein OSB38_21615 [Paraburkholderia fungorum]|nr:hypothetical protein [Paraburkholderia fungorum]
MTQSSTGAHVATMIRQNVTAQLNNIRTRPSVAPATARCRSNLHGWVFDLQSGRLEVLDSKTSALRPLAD